MKSAERRASERKLSMGRDPMSFQPPITTGPLDDPGALRNGSSGHEASITDACVVATMRDVACAAWTTARSVVLTGSMSRGEASWGEENNRLRLLGDAEFLVVFNDGVKLPDANQVSRVTSQVEARLCDRGIDAHVGLSPVAEKYLRALRPHIFAYELIAHGKVIAGDPDILQLTPEFSPVDIPLEDGFRLLMNRVIELLEALCDDDPGQSHRVPYRTLKLWLDMATSFLLFKGAYEPTYRARAIRLREMASSGSDFPIPADYFTDRVAQATSVKLGGRAEVAGRGEFPLFVNAVRELWRWQLQRLTGMSACASDAALRRKWSR